VIVVTGADELEQRVEGLASGASDYVVKPVALAELVARVNAHMRMADEWRAQVAEVIDARKAIAIDLAGIRPDGDLAAAARLITRAVSRVRDVSGAAFLIEGTELTVASSTGQLGLSEGTSVPGSLAAHIRNAGSSAPQVLTRGSLGLAGPGRVALVPFVVSARREAVIAVALLPHLPADRTQAALSALADLAVIAAPMVTPMIDRERAAEERRAHHARIIDHRRFSTVFQPIVDLTSGGVVGFEALTRFDDGMRPDLVFSDADEVGMRAQLERATAEVALGRAVSLPKGAYLSVNVSAATALDIDFLESLVGGDRDVVIEITEHDVVEDYDALEAALTAVRSRARLAVDDAGAGYAGLSHIRALRPDVIKLDRSVVSGLHVDPVARAMIAGMVHFAREIDCRVVAEGIETAEELATLVELGVSHGQGYLLGRPAAAPESPLVLAR